MLPRSTRIPLGTYVGYSNGKQRGGARSSPYQLLPVLHRAPDPSGYTFVVFCSTGSVSGSSQPKPSPVSRNVVLDTEDVVYAEEEHKSTDRASGLGHTLPKKLSFRGGRPEHSGRVDFASHVRQCDSRVLAPEHAPYAEKQQSLMDRTCLLLRSFHDIVAPFS